MPELLPWKQVESDNKFLQASDEMKDQVRRGWLQAAFEQNQDITPEEKVRMLLLVYGQNDPAKPADESTGVGGFLGQGAAKVGRTALKIIDAPFIPLHLAREKLLKPALEQIPGMDQPFNYQGVNEDKAAQGILHQNPGVQNIDQARMLRQLGVPAPAESIEPRTLGTRADVLSQGIEFAATGQYVKSILGTLASRGVAPAVRYIDNALRDLGVLEKWDERKLAFERAGRLMKSWEGKAQVMGSATYNKWMNEVADAGRRTALRDFLDTDAFTLSKTDPIAFTQKMSQFSPEEQNIVTWYLGRDEARRQLGLQFKIFRNPYDNYVARVNREEFEAGKVGALLQLHRQSKLSIAEQEALGKSPWIDDVAILDAVHENAFQRILGKKIFTDITRNIKAEDGLPGVLTDRAYEKLKVNNPEEAAQYVFANPSQTRASSYLKIMEGSRAEAVDNSAVNGATILEPADLYIHKDFYKQFRRFLPPRPSETAVGETIKGILSGSRRLIMANPLVHGVNISSTVVSSAPWGDVDKVLDLFGEGAKIKNLGLAGEEPYVSLVLQGAHDGLRVPAISSTWHQAAQDMMKSTTGKTHFWTPLTEANDKFLFDTIVSNPMYGMYKMVRDRWAPHLGQQEAGRIAAEYVNLNQGTIPTESFSPFMQKYGQWALFSRSWTLSNFRSLSQAAGIPWGARHISDAGQVALSREWAETWARSLAYMGMQNEVMNRAIAGHSAADNPKGHELDIDSGRYDKQGRRIYIAGSPFLFVRQMMRRGAHLADADIPGLAADFYGVMNTFKGAVEAVQGKDVFLNKEISPPGAPPEEQVARRAMHAVGALTPFGTQINEAMRPGASLTENVREIITSPEQWIHALTYWPTHGMTYTSDVFTRLKKADKALILNTMSPEARQGLIKGVAFGKIEGEAAVELKDMKDDITYHRGVALDKAYAEVMRGNMVQAATILVKAGWTMDGARDFIISRGRKTGRLQGEARE